MGDEYIYEMYKCFHYEKEFKINLKKNRPNIFNKEELKVIELFEELYSLDSNELKESKYNIRYCKDYVKLMLVYPECFVIKNEMLKKTEPSNKEFKVLDHLKNHYKDDSYKKDIFKGLKGYQKLKFDIPRISDVQMDIKFINTKNVNKISLDFSGITNSIYENKEKSEIIEIKEVMPMVSFSCTTVTFVFEFYDKDVSGMGIDFYCDCKYLLNSVRRELVFNALSVRNKDKKEIFYSSSFPDSIENYKEKGISVKLPDYIEEYHNEYIKYIYLGNQTEISGMIYLVLGLDDYRVNLNDSGKVELICKPNLEKKITDHLKKVQDPYIYINRLGNILKDKESPRPIKTKHYLPDKYKEFFKEQIYYYHLNVIIDYVFYPELYYLKKEIHEEIETHVRYRPGGTGYYEAKEHFEIHNGIYNLEW